MKTHQEKRDIYRRGDSLGKTQADLEADERVSPEERRVIKDFATFLLASSSGKLRAAKLTQQLHKICASLERPLGKVTRQDLETLLATFRLNEGWSPATVADYGRCLRQFFRWYRGRDERLEDPERKGEAEKMYDYLATSVRASYRREKIAHSTIITEEDLRGVLERGCVTAKQKAFIAVLHEGGFRAGEILNMRVRDVEVIGERVRVEVDGKTGKRRPPLLFSASYLLAWLDLHPFRADPEAYIWVSEARNRYLQPLEHNGAQQLVTRAFLRAGVKKRCNLHFFRHSRATINGKFMTESMLCEYLGWEQGSRMPRIYVHADMAQVEDVLCVQRGITRPETAREELMRCAVCRAVNQPRATYCARCGRPLTSEALHTREGLMTSAFDKMRQLMEDPALMAEFLRYCEQVRKQAEPVAPAAQP